MKSKQAINATIAAIVVSVVCFALWLHHLELERRGLWMDKIEAHKAEMEGFRAEVESRVHDRWTETEHNDREQEVFNSLFRDNPKMNRPPELEFDR